MVLISGRGLRIIMKARNEGPVFNEAPFQKISAFAMQNFCLQTFGLCPGPGLIDMPDYFWQLSCGLIYEEQQERIHILSIFRSSF